MVTKKFYIGALLLAVAAMAVLLGAARLYDDYKYASIERSVRDFTMESDETRLLMAYGEAFGKDDKQAYCEALEANRARQANRGYTLVSKLRELEKANLLADYAQVRRQYYLNNFELWLQQSAARNDCQMQTNSTLALFFVDTLTTCNDCIAQGELLNQIRSTCPNLALITLASDLRISPIDLAKKKFGVTHSPAIVINNVQTIFEPNTREELAKALGCA